MSIESFDDRIECPHCGHSFYHELNRCPNCRRSVYHPETDRPESVGPAFGVDPLESDASDSALERFRPLVGVGLGLVLNVAAGSLLFALFSRFLGELATPWALAALPVSTFAAAYAAEIYTEMWPRRIGLLVGLCSLPLLYLLSISTIEPPEGFNAVLIPFGLLTGLSGYGAGVLVQRQRLELLTDQLFTLPDEEQLLQSLLQKVNFEREAAERLIEYERQYALNGTRATLIMNAISRWERDNN